jgi:type II secretory pathway pseudopilin PulG
MKRPPLPWVAALRRRHSNHERYDERGDTMIEILVTLMVLSIAVVALIVTFETGIAASADHKNLAANDVVLRQVEEQAFYAVQQSSSPLYASCASVAGGQYATLNYPDIVNGNNVSIYNSLPSLDTVNLNPIQYWDTTAPTATFDGTCAADSPQLISLTLNVPNGSSATTTFVVDDLGTGPLGPLGSVVVSPPSAPQGTSNLALTMSGTGFDSNVQVSIPLSTGVTINSYAFVSSTLIDLNVNVSATATVQADSFTVTDPANSTYAVQTAYPTFSVTQATLAGMHVSSLTEFGFLSFLVGNIWPIVAVQVEDGNNHLMTHATVFGSWSVATGGFTTTQCTTDASGTCYILYGLLNYPPGPSSVYTVTNVTNPTGATYTPVPTSPYGDPPKITVTP